MLRRAHRSGLPFASSVVAASFLLMACGNLERPQAAPSPATSAIQAAASAPTRMLPADNSATEVPTVPAAATTAEASAPTAGAPAAAIPPRISTLQATARRAVLPTSALEDASTAPSIAEVPLPRTATPLPVPQGSCSAGCLVPPAGCLIKGWIAADGTKLFVVPGQLSYSVVKLDIARGDRWFCTADEARVAGWAAAKPSKLSPPATK